MRTKENAKNEKAPAFAKALNHIRVTVWENTDDNGKTWFNTTITRRYKDGDEWRDATSFSNLGDLALVTEACRLARDFIAARELSGPSDDA